MEVVQTIDRAGLRIGRLALDAKEEAWRRQNPLETALNAGVEIRSGSAFLVEIKQCLDILLGHGPSIGSLRQGRKNLPCARLFRCGVLRPAHKDLAAAR